MLNPARDSMEIRMLESADKICMNASGMMDGATIAQIRSLREENFIHGDHFI